MRTAVLLLAAVVLMGAAKPEEPTLPKLADGTFGYEEVVTVEGVAAADLLVRARSFAADGYRSAKAVIDLDDAAANRIVIRGEFAVPYMTASVRVDHKLSIEVKDGRYRYRLDNFGATWPTGPRRDLQDKWLVNTKLVPRTATDCEALIAQLKASMAKAPANW
jgi:hypothetical protein